jgi:PAS domain S-box-containing protein
MNNKHTILPFQTLIENITDIISIIASDGTIIYQSPSLKHVLGYQPEEIIGENAFSFVHPEDAPRVIACFHLTIQRSESPQPIAYRFRHKNNSWQTIESVGKAFHDPIKGLVAIINSRDITRRKPAEEAVRFQAHLLDTVEQAVIAADPGGTVTYWNRFAQGLYGWTADEALGRNIMELTTPEISQEQAAQIMSQLSAGKSRAGEFIVRDKDGKTFPAQVFDSPINDDEGNLIGIVRSSIDITERKQTEERLRQQLDFTSAITDNIAEGVYAFDKTGKLTFINQAAEEMFGWKQEDLLGRNIHQTVHYQQADGTLLSEQDCPFLSVIKSGVPLRLYEDVFTRKDGTVFHVLCSSVPMIINDEITGAVQIFHNLTEHKRVQEQFDHFFKVSVELLCFAGYDGYFKRLNPAWENALGYSEEELMAKPFIEFVHPADRERTIKETEENFKGLKSISFENRYLCKDGSYKWLLWNTATIPDEQMMYAVAHDITERKQMEDALRESREHLALAQQVARIGSFEFNLQPKQAVSSLALESLYGVLPGDLNRNYEDWIKHVHPEDLPEVEGELERILSSGKHDSEFRIIQKDGSVRWLSSKGKVFYDDEGAPMRLVGVNMDVTERKQAEAALAEASKHAIFEYIRLLERLATLGQKLGAARDLTAVFSAILDFARDSVPCSALLISLYDKDKSVRKVIYLWYNNREMDVSNLEAVAVGEGSVGQAIKSGEVLIFNDYLKTLKKKPSYVYFGFEEDSREPRSAIIAPMKIMGNAIGAIEVQSYDLGAYTQEHSIAMRMAAHLAASAIENVRLLEQERVIAEQLRQAQKLESVGRLAGGIAHDFNNMLTAINGYSELILRRLSDKDPLRGNIEEIKKAGERSAVLTHQLLAFSRRQVLRTKVIGINQVVTETSAMLQRLIGEDIRLNLRLDPKLGHVEVDPGQLTQVIMNLAVNARDAMPEGGVLTIKTSNVYLNEEYAARHVPTQPGSYVMLAFRDTGMGMDDETQQHIFEPFFTTKEVGKGTGLGLATVYGIVKQSGGYIWVDSDLGKGTIFRIYLPRIDEKVLSSEENGAPERIPKGNETILLVEDEETVRNLSRQILEACGYKVIEADNGRDALSICLQQDCKIDLLITDVVMPKMSGRQLVERLAILRPEITVLYMSGYTDDAVVRQGAIETDANFIQKPFTFNTLTDKVRELLDAKNGAVKG